jgi:hypothetical protein
VNHRDVCSSKKALDSQSRAFCNSVITPACAGRRLILHEPTQVTITCQRENAVCLNELLSIKDL